jgi:hypothetical protein
MLRFVEHPVVVNPDPFLESVALEEHWEIMRPHRPQKNRLAFAIDTARQSLGLWTPPLTAA